MATSIGVGAVGEALKQDQLAVPTLELENTKDGHTPNLSSLEVSLRKLSVVRHFLDLYFWKLIWSRPQSNDHSFLREAGHRYWIRAVDGPRNLLLVQCAHRWLPLRGWNSGDAKMLFRYIAAVGRAMPHGARRFVLDRLGLSRVFGAIAEGKSARTVLDGKVVTYNPLLHGAIIRGGEIVYEDHVAVAVRQNLRSESVFYDIGANIGVFSVIAESVGARAYAFEPEENNLLHLRRNVSNAIDMAIGVKDGTATFDRRGGAFSGRISSEPVGKRRTVVVRTIDSLAAEGWPVPHLIKIDVEGTEGEVLEGAIETLRNHHPVVICELHGFSDGPERARSVLESVGYEIQSIGGNHIICIHPEAPQK